MTFIVADRVQETAVSPGTGTITLLGASLGYQTFSAGIGANNTTFYAIADQSGANWEVGLGTVGAGGTTLARTTILASSNSGSIVNFATNTQNVWCDYPAGKAILLNASGQVTFGGNGYADWANATGTTVAAGRMWYDGATGSWNLGMGNGNITQQVGEELFRYGKASAAITDSPLQLVYKTGVVGASGVITFAPTVANITDYDLIIGCATESIALNGFGRVTSWGVIHGITTNGTAYGETWADNDDIYYNPTTGGLTKTLPAAPKMKLLIGTVINAAGGGAGSFVVKLGVSTTLSELSDVQVTSVATSNLLNYNGTNWVNVAPSSVTGVGSVANSLSVGTGLSGTSFNGSAAVSWTLATAYGDSINPYASKTANYVLAAPNGSAGVPSFRAIVAADIPTLNQNTTGSSGSCTGNAATATNPASGGSFITSSNIGSQSVSYATNAGNASTVTNGVYTTAFGNSLGGNGYARIQGGLIIQWGVYGSLGANTRTTQGLPIAFPNNYLSVSSGNNWGAASGSGGWAPSGACPNNSSSVVVWNTDDQPNTVWWIAVGY